MGKTALLLELADRAGEYGFVVARVTSSEQMLQEILQTIQINGEKYIPKPRKIKGVSAGALGFSLGLTFSDEVERKYGFRIKLAMLADELAKHDKGVLILVDEVQSTGLAMRELATTYQHLIGEQKNIAIAMAGLPNAVSAVLNDEVLTFLNRAHKVTLQSIAIPEVELYYANAFKEMRKTVTPELLSRAAQATRGYPYLMQLIGYNTIELSKNDQTILAPIVSAAIELSTHTLTENVFATSIKLLSEKDIQFLHAMAQDVDESRTAKVMERLQVSNSYFQQYRQRLLDAGLIAQERRGVYAFTLPYMGEYLRGEL
jgi:hypothetical protein